MTESIGRPAPELAVPYWIDAAGKESPPLPLKELGARHRLLFLPALVRWLPLAPISNSRDVGSRSPHRGCQGPRSPDRIRGRLRQYARQGALRPAALRPPDSLRP